ncbi:RING/FYVE/PHD zinc finger superfamily protein [Arabidopsis thaliana]|uniref:RING/FYVE/PHD zinc finger superfamily protein n=2 Tax=Arabidopsis thaliana TaxID=3702 RepID=A0A1P8BG27_ARATH|nr:RING/FYVE/PHD zinc finger superfamily protein [Arabidopsis thaliana]NP_001332121.1 RING/FYVE/PHD zinc finger superfamily protein [Arabidopsis thaliana]ANM70515.1 RING/FYVE/PHD zinc finger superfamily protein [Arabidopsis thaliana]ANM70516.1 RING/FYVE/PHD zinc finger superfamily protein [Arabidopsis thaliana]|eukprot:NP_001332120.1 RING/FYVE/PHD zinc finger superfamily protein [Arabidopsis thaliana]
MLETNEQKGFDLNVCASIEDFSESDIKAEGETDSLVDGNVENVIEIKDKKKVIEREILITRRVLRSGSVARDLVNSDKHCKAVKRKGNVVSGGSSVDEVKEEVKQECVKSLVPEEIRGDDFRSEVKVESKDDRSDDGKEEKVQRKRGRPRKFGMSSQSDDNGLISNCKLRTSLGKKKELVGDDNVEKLVGGSCFNKEKAEVKLEHGEYAEDKEILGLDFRSQVKVEIKDDECGIVELHDEELQVKRKRGRPRKVQISSQSDESRPNTNCKLARTPELSSQSSVDRISLSRLRGRPPKTKETSVSLYIEKGPESNGRRMVRKRGRPPTPQKKRKSGMTDESDWKAKKRLKLCESPLESRHNNPLIDDERMIGEQRSKQTEAGGHSRSKSKKMLSDRILQLLLTAGWTVEYRPRNGRAYQDAVYLNPEGKTHWSVTKAYQVYKKQLESNPNDQKNSTTGSGFGLLPEEDLHLLERTIQKKRSDTGKQRSKLKDRDTNDILVSTKGTGKIKREEKHSRKRCTPSARSSLKDVDSKEDGYILFEGKRTMLGWMIDSTIVPLNGKVQCMDCKKTDILLEGIITKEGIRCNCCDEVFSVLDFEVHAGGNRNQPFKSLYLEGGNSLLQCLHESMNKQSESQLKGYHFVDFGSGDPNDDTCGICGDGGDLICCDGCPSTFHQSCLDIKKFPSGAWYCYNCSCKFCEKDEAAKHETSTLPSLSSCRLCEEKYHQACINQDGTVPGERSTDSFCGKYCQELFEELQLFIGVKHPLPEGFSWSFLRRFELPSEVADCDISEKIAYNAKMAVAFSVMDECFSPLVDHRSGVNLLQNIVYNFGSNFHRLDFSSFLTAVLERGDEIIAVASIRIHGNQLAEMPFIGTRYMYRRQGMCRRLMDGIESFVAYFSQMFLAISEVLLDVWQFCCYPACFGDGPFCFFSGFGFAPVNDSEKKTIKNLNLLVFPGVDMLGKSLVKEKITDSVVSSPNGLVLLAPEMTLPVDVEENKPEESKDSAHERNCATAGVESPSNPVDSCLKLTYVEEGDNDRESNLKLLDGSVEEKEDTKKLTDIDINSLPDEVDDSHADQSDTKEQEIDDKEDKTPLSDDGCEGKAEGTKESNQQPDSNKVDNSQPLGNGGTGEELGNRTLALKREVTPTLRASPRLIQRSWRTSRVNQKFTGTTNAVLLDSPHRCV